MVDVPHDEEYTSPSIPVCGDFPETAEDEPLSRSQHPRLNVLGLIFTMVFAADLGSSISKAPLVRGPYPQNLNCPFHIYYHGAKHLFPLICSSTNVSNFQG